MELGRGRRIDEHARREQEQRVADLIDATTEKLAQFVSRKLDDVDRIAMFVDGIEFAGHSVVIALGVTIDGTKTPLGRPDTLSEIKDRRLRARSR